MNIEEDNLAIREMQDTDADYQLMLDWLSDDEVAEHYGGRNQDWTMEKIRAKYSRKINELDHMTCCIVEHEGKPIGFLQFYETCKDGEPEGKEPKLWMQPGNYNIDMFIGEPSLWNQGIGSTVLRMTAEYLLQNDIATTVTIDPKTNNDRAIRAYEKAGFEKVEVIPEWEEQNGKKYDAWLMSYTANSDLTYGRITDANDINVLRGKESQFANLHIKYDEEDIEMLKKYLQREDSLYALVKCNNNFVAFCSTDSDWWEPNYFFLREIFVMPEYQGKGVGEKLMRDSINHAKRNGSKGIVTETAFENVPMQKLCEKCGFEKWENPEWQEGVTYKIVLR